MSNTHGAHTDGCMCDDCKIQGLECSTEAMCNDSKEDALRKLIAEIGWFASQWPFPCETQSMRLREAISSFASAVVGDLKGSKIYRLRAETQRLEGELIDMRSACEAAWQDGWAAGRESPVRIGNPYAKREDGR